MPMVLTAGAKITCPHMGKLVLVPSQSELKIGTQPVLVDGDLDTALISGCTLVPDPNTGTAPCMKVAKVNGGQSTKYKVGTKFVMLDTASGTTSGTVGPFSWSVQDAGQTKFTSG